VDLLDEDSAVVDSNMLETTFEFLRNAQISKKVVFMHSFAGISRSPTMVLFFLMSQLKFRLLGAYNYVREIRNIEPNAGFMKQLMLYEKETTGECTMTWEDYYYYRCVDMKVGNESECREAAARWSRMAC